MLSARFSLTTTLRSADLPYKVNAYLSSQSFGCLAYLSYATFEDTFGHCSVSGFSDFADAVEFQLITLQSMISMGHLCSESAFNAARDTMCSPVRSTRPEKRPMRKASAHFSLSRSGNATVTMVRLLMFSMLSCCPLKSGDFSYFPACPFPCPFPSCSVTVAVCSSILPT